MAQTTFRPNTFGLCLTVVVWLLLTSVGVPAQGTRVPSPQELPWAFPNGGPVTEHPVDEVPRRVPGSERTYTMAQIEDRFAPPDWFPSEHAPMPDVVARGRRPDVQACARCHLTHGFGHPQSANLAGLPSAYIAQQMRDFASGRRSNSAFMSTLAKAITAKEITAAADYFAASAPARWVRVVESATVPKSHVGGGGLRLRDDGAGTEPLGQRIIELPEDDEQIENRSPRTGFVAYVPTGSLAAGEALVNGGAGKTVGCSACHGPELRGAGSVPSIAGRSPIGAVRQLLGFRSGTRNGDGAALMKGVVERLTLDDIIAIASYTASLRP